MFFVVNSLERTMIMHPKYASANESFSKIVKKKSHAELEGSFDPYYGYIVLVIKYNYISKDVMINADGMLEGKVDAKVVCLAPMQGEIVDAVVRHLSRESVLVSFGGLLSCTVKATEFSYDDYVYFKMEKRDDKEKSEIQPSAYYHLRSDPLKDIKVGSCVRIKIIERMIGSKGYFCTGTMNDGATKLGVRKNPNSA